MEQLRQSQQECAQKDRNIHDLNERFQQIQRGLGAIDAERESLKKEIHDLTRQQQDLRRELQMREKEVQTLVRRCKEEETKVKEATRIRSENSSLTGRIEELRTSLSVRESDKVQTEKLQRELQRMTESRDSMEATVRRLERDNNSVTETLTTCFQRMESLNKTIRDLERERDEIAQSAKSDLEQQKVEHRKDCDALQADVRHKQNRIEHMEKALQRNNDSIAKMRNDKLEMKASLETEISKLRKASETEADAIKTAIKAENETNWKRAANEYEAAICVLKGTVRERDSTIASMTDELAVQMERLKEASDSLEEAHKFKTEATADLRLEIESLRSNRDALGRQVEQERMRSTALSVSVATLNAEKVDLQGQLETVRDRLAEVEADNAFLLDMERQLEDLNVSIAESQSVQLTMARQEEETLEGLKTDFDNQLEMWQSMEKGLLERIIVVEEEKRGLEERLQQELERTNSNHSHLEEEVARIKEEAIEARNDADTKAREADVLRERVESLEAALVAEQQNNEDLVKQSAELHVSVDDLRTENATRTETDRTTIEHLRSELDSVTNERRDAIEETQNLRESVARAESQSARLETETKTLQEQRQKLETELDDAKQSIETLRESLNRTEKEETTSHIAVQQLEGSLSAAQSEARSLRDELRTAEIEREALQDQLRLAEADKAELKTEVEQMRLKHERTSTELVANLDRVRELEAVTQRAKTDNDAADVIRVTLEEMLQKKESDCTELNQRLRSVQSERDELAVEIQSVQKSMRLLETEKDRLAKENQTVNDLQRTTESELQACTADRDHVANKSRMLAEHVLKTEVALAEQAEELAKERVKTSELEAVQKQLQTTLIETNRRLRDAATVEDALAGLYDDMKESILSDAHDSETTLGRTIELAVRQTVSKASSEANGISDDMNGSEGDTSADTIDRLRRCTEDTRTIIRELLDHTTALEEESKTRANDIALLRTESESRDTLCQSLRDLLQDATDENMTLQETIQKNQSEFTSESKSTQSRLEELNDRFEAEKFRLEQELTQSKERSLETTDLVDGLRLQLTDQEQQHQEALDALRQESSEAVKRLEDQLQTALSAAESSSTVAETASKQRDIVQAEKALADDKSRVLADTIQSLQEELELAKAVSATKEERAAALLEQKSNELREATSRIEALQRSALTEQETLQKSLRTRQATITALTKGITAAKEDLAALRGSTDERISSLERQLGTRDVDLAIARDEIRDLRLVDMKEAEETIATLQTELKTFRMDRQSDVEKLSQQEAKIKELSDENRSLQKRLDDGSHMHSSSLSKTRNELEMLREENNSMAVQLRGQRSILENRKAGMDSLTAENKRLEDTKRSLSAEVERLGLECETAKHKEQQALLALDHEIQRRLTSQEGDEMGFKKERAMLEVRIADAESTVGIQKRELARVEAALEERSSLLAGVVSQNKELEAQLAASQDRLQMLEPAEARLKREAEQAQKELSIVQTELEVKTRELSDTLDFERNLREIAEEELESLRVQLANTKRHNKDSGELEKENAALRDKVNRQESFLKRKLKKEKTLRSRQTPGPTTGSVPAGLPAPTSNRLRTPGTNRSVRSAGRGSMIPSASKATSRIPSYYPSTLSTSSVMSDISSIVDDWE